MLGGGEGGRAPDEDEQRGGAEGEEEPTAAGGRHGLGLLLLGRGRFGGGLLVPGLLGLVVGDLGRSSDPGLVVGGLLRLAASRSPASRADRAGGLFGRVVPLGRPRGDRHAGRQRHIGRLSAGVVFNRLRRRAGRGFVGGGGRGRAEREVRPQRRAGRVRAGGGRLRCPLGGRRAGGRRSRGRFVNGLLRGLPLDGGLSGLSLLNGRPRPGGSLLRGVRLGGLRLNRLDRLCGPLPLGGLLSPDSSLIRGTRLLGGLPLDGVHDLNRSLRLRSLGDGIRLLSGLRLRLRPGGLRLNRLRVSGLLRLDRLRGLCGLLLLGGLLDPDSNLLRGTRILVGLRLDRPSDLGLSLSGLGDGPRFDGGGLGGLVGLRFDDGLGGLLHGRLGLRFRHHLHRNRPSLLGDHGLGGLLRLDRLRSLGDGIRLLDGLLRLNGLRVGGLLLGGLLRLGGLRGFLDGRLRLLGVGPLNDGPLRPPAGGRRRLGLGRRHDGPVLRRGGRLLDRPEVLGRVVGIEQGNSATHAAILSVKTGSWVWGNLGMGKTTGVRPAPDDAGRRP